MKPNIKLGNIVRDAITGFTGTATQLVEYMSGNVQFAVCAKSDDPGKFPESLFIDHHTLDVLEEGIADRATTPAKTDIKLGQRVRDKASGLVGIALVKLTYINGCVSFQVMPKLTGKEMITANPDQAIIDHARLEVVDDGLVQEVKPVSVKAPGGPAKRMARPTRAMG